MTGPGLALSPGRRIGLLCAVAAVHAIAFLHWAEMPSPVAMERPVEVTMIATGEAAVDIPEAVAAPSTAAPPEPAPPETTPAADARAPAADRQISPEPLPEVVETPASDIRVETAAKPPPPHPARPEKRPTERVRKPAAAAPRPPSRHAADTSDDAGSAAASRARTRMGADGGQQAVTAASRASYAAQVIAEFNRHKVYPDAARQSHQQGTASLSFSIGASGAVISYRIIRSTGSAALDRAIDAMMTAARPPPPPDGMFRGQFAVRFSLND